jgi:hypothetical protein
MICFDGGRDKCSSAWFGLGRMGANIAMRLMQAGHERIAYIAIRSQWSSWSRKEPRARTLQAAIDEGVHAPVLGSALFERFELRGLAEYADKLLSGAVPTNGKWWMAASSSRSGRIHRVCSEQDLLLGGFASLARRHDRSRPISGMGEGIRIGCTKAKLIRTVFFSALALAPSRRE